MKKVSSRGDVESISVGGWEKAAALLPLPAIS